MYYVTIELVKQNLKWKSDIVTCDDFFVWRFHWLPSRPRAIQRAVDEVRTFSLTATKKRLVVFVNNI